MKKIIHTASNRGRSQYQWLDSWHSFSFSGYYDPNKVHFGALRVLNDDIIFGGGGFGTHPHDNMEIITIPIYGALKHADSMKHEQVIAENEVQVMSAGKGIFHSEFNASPIDDVNLLQIWIFPDTKNVKPVYDQKYFKPADAKNQWQFLVSSIHQPIDDSLTIHQNASIARMFLDKGQTSSYQFQKGSFGSYLFVVSGEIEIDGEKIGARDAIGIYDTQNFEMMATSDSFIINIEVPSIL